MRQTVVAEKYIEKYGQPTHSASKRWRWKIDDRFLTLSTPFSYDDQSYHTHVLWEIWDGSKRILHRENGPANISYDAEGNIYTRSYHLKGKKVTFSEVYQEAAPEIQKELLLNM